MVTFMYTDFCYGLFVDIPVYQIEKLEKKTCKIMQFRLAKAALKY